MGGSGALRKQIKRTFQEEEEKKVFVIINSFGGSVGNGITVHDALQFIKAGSLTLGLGVAASAASLVLAGGTISERYVTEGCHTMIHQPECLTPDHNVLTKRGWISITEVTLEDQVATLQNEKLIYAHPTKIHKYEYEGKLYEVKNNEINLKVTLNHRMWIATKNLDKKGLKFSLQTADSLLGKRVRYKKNAIWSAPDYQFILPGVEIFFARGQKKGDFGAPTPKISQQNGYAIIDDVEIGPGEGAPAAIRPLKIHNMDTWLIFMGFFISEGWVVDCFSCGEPSSSKEEKHHGVIQMDAKRDYKIVISHKKPDTCLIIEDTFKQLGWHYRKEKGTHAFNYVIYDKQLWSYLRDYSPGAHKKVMPSWVWDLSTRQCNLLLDALIAGNGYINENNKTRHYFTSSEELAMQVSRLILHAGYSASITKDCTSIASETLKTTDDGKTFLKSGPLWRVNVLKNHFPYANYLKPTSSELQAVAGGALGAGDDSSSLPHPFSFDASEEQGVVSSPVFFPPKEKKQNPSFPLILPQSMRGSFLSEEKGTRKDETSAIGEEEEIIDGDDLITEYSGPVYCLTVPGEVFYVQREGVSVWTGNSGFNGQASDIWIDSQEIMKIRLDVAEIYSLSAHRPRHRILRDLDRDFYLTAPETIHYGLADEIATNEVMHSIIEETSKVWNYHDSKQLRLLEARGQSDIDTQTQN